MVSKYSLTTLVLCGVAILLGVEASRAGGRIGGAYSGGSNIGGAYSSGRYGAGESVFGGSLYGSGFYGGGLFYGDYLTGGGYPGFFAPYVYPRSSYYYADPYTPHVPAYAPPLSFRVPPVSASPATIRVVLADPNATVLFDGRPTTSPGTERFFTTPDLTPGGSYHYQLRATWTQDGKQMTREQTIAVSPGRTSDVIFGR